MRRLAATLLALSVAGCGVEQSLIGGTAQGTPLDPGAKPAVDDCAQLLREETAAAKAIRAEYRIAGVEATDLAVGVAASDPNADLGALGIPITQAELAAVKASGFFIDATTRIANWAHLGATDRFGGVWIDPPGTDQFVVSIVGSNPRTLALARCVEPPKIRYVHAVRSLAEGLALQERVGNDWEALRAQGIEINGTSYSEIEGILEIGVGALTPEIESLLRQRYGDAVRVVQQGPAEPQ
jgi:hypothetical protein